MDLSGKYSEFREGLGSLDDLYFILLAVLLAFGTLQTAGTVLDTDKPVVTVVSTSMCPEMQVGDILFVKGASYDQINEQDIIVYDVPDRVEFSVDGNSYTLEINGSKAAISTSIGDIEVLEVQPARNRDRDRVILSVDGTRLDEALIEGESYQISGHDLRIDYATDLPPGDIPVVHRVVERKDDYVETLGDANSGQLEFETRVEPDQIHGKVFFKVPRLGLVKLWTMDLMGYAGDSPLVIDNTPSCQV